MSWVLRELPTNPEIKFRWRFHGETVAIRKQFWLGFRPLFWILVTFRFRIACNWTSGFLIRNRIGEQLRVGTLIQNRVPLSWSSVPCLALRSWFWPPIPIGNRLSNQNRIKVDFWIRGLIRNRVWPNVAALQWCSKIRFAALSGHWCFAAFSVHWCLPAHPWERRETHKKNQGQTQIKQNKKSTKQGKKSQAFHYRK